jgi:hypothetical protein
MKKLLLTVNRFIQPPQPLSTVVRPELGIKYFEVICGCAGVIKVVVKFQLFVNLAFSYTKE